MVWEQPSDVQMGFYGFRMAWSPAQLQVARSGDAGALGQQVLGAQVPGGWRLESLQAVMVALIPDLDVWRAVVPLLVPGDPDERFMQQQLAEALRSTRPHR